MENTAQRLVLPEGVMGTWITKGPCFQKPPSSPGKQLHVQVRNTSQVTVNLEWERYSSCCTATDQCAHCHCGDSESDPLRHALVCGSPTCAR